MLAKHFQKVGSKTSNSLDCVRSRLLTTRSPSCSYSANMADKLYISETPDDVKNAKGLHLITQNTPNGQATQIMLEELGAKYGTKWTTSVINISTNVQKSEWFLRLNPNGRIPTLVDNSQSPPVSVIETSAQLLYLLKFHDKEDVFGFKDDLERLNCLEWMFFWHVGLTIPLPVRYTHIYIGWRSSLSRASQPLQPRCSREDPLRDRTLQERDAQSVRCPGDPSVRQIHRRAKRLSCRQR